jgi:hypothetical protein
VTESDLSIDIDALIRLVHLACSCTVGEETDRDIAAIAWGCRVLDAAGAQEQVDDILRLTVGVVGDKAAHLVGRVMTARREPL